jgi:glycosyltransferase involved in cell wall biosynthesis
MKYNIHIAAHDPLKNPGRILKETQSLIENKIFDEIIIIGKYSPSLPIKQRIDENRIIIRIKFPEKVIGKLKRYIKKLISGKRIKTVNHLITENNELSNIKSQNNSKKEMFKSFLGFKVIASLSDQIYEYGIQKKIWNIIKIYKSPVINAHSFEFISITLNLAKKANGKAIYDAHELESQRIGLSKYFEKRIMKLETKKLPKYNAIIVVGNEIKKWYQEQYKNIVTPIVVRNIPKKWVENPKKDNFYEIFNIHKKKIILLYNGNLSAGRGIEILLNIAANETLDERFVFIFMGFGPMEADIKKHVYYETKVFFKNAVEPDEVVAFTQSADIGLSIFQNKCLSYNYALPNKLFEYILSGLCVLGGITFSQKQFIRNNDIGVSASEESVEEYVEILNHLTTEKIEYYKNKSKELRKELSWENEVKAMIKEYRRILQD